MKEQIPWPSLGANNCNPCPPPLTREPKPCSITVKMSMEKGHWRLQPFYRPNQPSGRHEQTTIFRLRTGHCKPVSTPEANWHHELCTLQLQRSRTDGPPHPPGLFHLAATETPFMATGWVNHQQVVGNGWRPALHHPTPGNMWTEGLSTADRLQKKKPTSLNTIPKSIQIDWKLWDNCHRNACYLALMWPWIKIKVIRLVSKCRVQQYLSSDQVWIK